MIIKRENFYLCAVLTAAAGLMCKYEHLRLKV